MLSTGFGETPMAARWRRRCIRPKVLLTGETHVVDLLAGGWELRMGIKLLWGYCMSMGFTPGELAVVERL